MKRKRKTAGELSLKASADTTKYDSLEVGHALCDDVGTQLELCGQNHKDKITQDQFCVVMVIAKDPLIKNLMRRKFYAWPYLPSPRPNQSVFLYSKHLGCIVKRLWVLPDPFCMAALSEKTFVHDCWRNMKRWSDAFFKHNFWETIREEHNITMLSEQEYLDAERKKLVEPSGEKFNPVLTETFDFSKVALKKIIDPDLAFSN